MDSAKLNDWMQVVGIFAVVVSLLFVGLQMRQSQSIAMSEGALANAANSIDKNAAIRENSDIWLRGNAGEELDEDDEIVFQSVVRAALVADFMEITRLRRVGADDIADTLTADFSSFLFEHPGARKTWTEDRQTATKYRSLLVPGHYITDDEFSETVKSHLEQLDQLQDR